MARYEEHLRCSFRDLEVFLNEYILGSSISASLEDESQFTAGDICCVTRVYERYSWIGSNRLSLSLTLFGRDGDVRLSAITAGGSQAMFFKINTFGESAFLDQLVAGVEKFKRDH
ncbi:MAG: hypothetical protein IJ214_01225 [Clostridia bacterium]|nr:hypothetical protein [Clostridia bacterium]